LAIKETFDSIVLRGEIMRISIVLLLSLFQFAFADWSESTIDGMKYYLYLPKNLSTTKPLSNALMINLHGCSQKAEDLKLDGNWVNAADEYNMIVALPKVPNGGKYMGCWDYYGPDHTRQNRDNVAILKLVNSLLSGPHLNIDPNQIYVSGLSSGGGESLVLGCLAPDVFAGIGLNAGPIIGTTANEISKAPANFDTYLKTCLKLADASNNRSHFKTQLASIIYGNNDFIVNTKHDLMNADLLSSVYQATLKSTFDTHTLPGSFTDGTGTLFSDGTHPRISLIMNSNLGHNWPAGQGGNGTNFINKKSINYPLYLTKFFFKNNLRAKNVFLPELKVKEVEERNNKIYISALINNKILSKNKKINLEIHNLLSGKVILNDQVDVVNSKVEYLSSALSPGEYLVKLQYLDNFGKREIYRHQWIGEIPGEMSPQLFNVVVNTNNNCLSVRGQAISNGNQSLKSVQFDIDQNQIDFVDLNNSFFNYKNCNLSNGHHTIKISVANLNSTESNSITYSFAIGINEVTSNLFDHMMAGRLNWKDYAHWFAIYHDLPFTLYLNSNGTWSDKESYY
jgi:poly(3-hydroxybutyrate) depolymerase